MFAPIAASAAAREAHSEVIANHDALLAFNLTMPFTESFRPIFSPRYLAMILLVRSSAFITVFDTRNFFAPET